LKEEDKPERKTSFFGSDVVTAQHRIRTRESRPQQTMLNNPIIDEQSLTLKKLSFDHHSTEQNISDLVTSIFFKIFF